MVSKETGKHARLYADGPMIPWLTLICGEPHKGARISDGNGCQPVTDFTTSESYQIQNPVSIGNSNQSKSTNISCLFFVHCLTGIGLSALGVILTACLLSLLSKSCNAEWAVILLSQTTTVPRSHLTLICISALLAK